MRAGGRTRQGRRFARRVVLAGPVAIATILSHVGPMAAADPVSFGSPTSSSAFGKSIEFVQPVTLAAAPTRVELLLKTPHLVIEGFYHSRINAFNGVFDVGKLAIIFFGRLQRSMGRVVG